MADKDTKKSGDPKINEDGTATTEEGKKVELTPPAVPEGAPDVDEEKVEHKGRALSEEEVDKLVGDLEPGESGWIPLDEKGKPTGPAKKGTPPEGQLAHTVVAPARPPRQAIMTPSGAPITDNMNPDPSLPPRPGRDRDYKEVAEQEAKRREERRERRGR